MTRQFDVVVEKDSSETIAVPAPVFANAVVYVSAMVVDGGASARVSRRFAFNPAKEFRPSYTGMR
jgi:hypothetical protein